MKWADAFKKGTVFNLSNSLSVSRVLMLPFFWIVAFRYSDEPERVDLFAIILGIIFLAALTDFLDGYLARKLNQVTILGRYLDPVCDKLVTLVAMLLLVLRFSFPIWAFSFYILREILGIWLGSYLYFKRDIQGVPNIWGKLGVGIISLCAIWYVCLPFLKTVLPEGHPLLWSWIGPIAMVVVLSIGIIVYSVTYWDVVFHPDRQKPNT